MINNLGYQRLSTKLNRRNYNESKPHTTIQEKASYYDHDHQFKVIILCVFLPFIYKFIHSLINRQHTNIIGAANGTNKLPKRKQKQDNYETYYNIL